MMRITLRQPRAFKSALGFMDIKTGATIVVIFALLNKVAGIYGLIAIFHGGTISQVSMYVYSVLVLAAFAWGMKAITEEDPQRTFYFAHIFLGDHLLNTIWTVFFAVSWWVYNPHDGQRIANSDAQKDMMDMGGPSMTAEERLAAAQKIWNLEKGHAAGVLIIGWLLKVYFAALIYSYAIHLRSGSYRSLPLTNPIPEAFPHANGGTGADNYELDEDEFYATPLRSSGGGLAGFDTRPSRLGNGNSQAGTKSSKKILQDLEAPTESVLWDEEDEDEQRGRGGRTSMGDESDGDIGSSSPRGNAKTRNASQRSSSP